MVPYFLADIKKEFCIPKIVFRLIVHYTEKERRLISPKQAASGGPQLYLIIHLIDVDEFLVWLLRIYALRDRVAGPLGLEPVV